MFPLSIYKFSPNTKIPKTNKNIWQKKLVPSSYFSFLSLNIKLLSRRLSLPPTYCSNTWMWIPWPTKHLTVSQRCLSLQSPLSLPFQYFSEPLTISLTRVYSLGLPENTLLVFSSTCDCYFLVSFSSSSFSSFFKFWKHLDFILGTLVNVLKLISPTPCPHQASVPFQ